MNVTLLIEALQKLPGDAEVIVGSDDEGNDFVHPYYPSLQWCVEDDTRCGWRPVADEDIEDGEYEVEDLEQKVVL